MTDKKIKDVSGVYLRGSIEEIRDWIEYYSVDFPSKGSNGKFLREYKEFHINQLDNIQKNTWSEIFLMKQISFKFPPYSLESDISIAFVNLLVFIYDEDEIKRREKINETFKSI